MKKLIKISLIYLCLPTYSFPIHLLFDPAANQIAVLENGQYPINAQLSNKTITFVSPKYDQNMLLLLEYKDNGSPTYKYQSFKLSNKHEYKITLLQTLSNKDSIGVYLAPTSAFETYLPELKNLETEKSLSDKAAVIYVLDQNQTKEHQNKMKEFNDHRQELMNKIQYLGVINFNKLKIDDRFTLQTYKVTPKKPVINKPTQPPLDTKKKAEQIVLKIPAQEVVLNVEIR